MGCYTLVANLFNLGQPDQFPVEDAFFQRELEITEIGIWLERTGGYPVVI